jgi:hypothetical protein
MASTRVHAAEAATVFPPERNEAIGEQRDAVEQAQEELAEAADHSGFDDFVGGLFGSDGGAADVESELHSSRSDVDRVTAGIETGQQSIDQTLRELSGYQDDGGGGGHDHHSGVTQAEIYEASYADDDDPDPLDG